MSVLTELSDDYDRASALVNILIDHATGTNPSEQDYLLLRDYLTKQADWQHLLPRWFPTQRSLNQFWHYIKNQYPTYAERRTYLWNEFEPLLSHLEADNVTPAEDDIEDTLKTFTSGEVSRSWRRMVNRVKNDPEGAITASRNLIETVLKHILDERNIDYAHDRIEMPALYKLVQTELNIAPEQHQEQVFKQILGGCSAVVNGLGALRNKLGDAHGTGVDKVCPAARHAKLAVNLAGSMTLFLTETHLAKTAEQMSGESG